MKTSFVLFSLMCCGISLASQRALAQNNKETLVRYRDLEKPHSLASLLVEGDTNKTFEFIAGDRIPVEVKFQSDVFAIEQHDTNSEQGSRSVSFVVKTPFLMRFAPEPSISFDSVRFVPIGKAFTGNIGFAIGADSSTDTKAAFIQIFGEMIRKAGQ